MKRKYYVYEKDGKVKSFATFNQMLRTLKLKEEEQIKLAEVLGTVAFTGKEEVHYKNEMLGLVIEYK